jgi:hypothetical protein
MGTAWIPSFDGAQIVPHTRNYPLPSVFLCSTPDFAKLFYSLCVIAAICHRYEYIISKKTNTGHKGTFEYDTQRCEFYQSVSQNEVRESEHTARNRQIISAEINERYGKEDSLLIFKVKMFFPGLILSQQLIFFSSILISFFDQTFECIYSFLQMPIYCKAFKFR